MNGEVDWAAELQQLLDVIAEGGLYRQVDLSGVWKAIIGCYAALGVGMAGIYKWVSDRTNKTREREDVVMQQVRRREDDLMEHLRTFESQVVQRLTAIETELRVMNNPGDDH